MIPAQRDGSVSKQIVVEVRNCKHKNTLGISGKKKLTLMVNLFRTGRVHLGSGEIGLCSGLFGDVSFQEENATLSVFSLLYRLNYFYVLPKSTEVGSVAAQVILPCICLF